MDSVYFVVVWVHKFERTCQTVFSVTLFSHCAI